MEGSVYFGCSAELNTNATSQLLLNKSPIPITISESDLIVTEEALREGIPELCDRMNWSFAPPPDIAEQPLVRWKITWLPQTGDTAIVIHACHVLGDGGVIAQMQSTVSDFYQGRAPEWPMPTYEKYFELPPRLPAERFNEVLHKHIPNLITCVRAPVAGARRVGPGRGCYHKESEEEQFSEGILVSTRSKCMATYGIPASCRICSSVSALLPGG